MLGGLVAFFGVTTEHFLTLANARTLLNQLPPLLVVAAGITLVLLAGDIDLSVGSVLALSSCVAGALVAASAPLLAAVAAALVTGLVCGALNGLVVARFAAPSFLVTLGMLEMARGASYLVTDSQTLYAGAAVASLGWIVPGLGLSAAFVGSLLVLGALQVGLSHTAAGRHILAVGGNAEALERAGIDPRRVRWMLLATAGLLAGLGGVFQLGYLRSADPNAGLGLELAAIAAVVVGGTSLRGGSGSIVGTLLGVLVIAVLQAGLAQAGVSDPNKRIVIGVVIVAAVLVDARRRR